MVPDEGVLDGDLAGIPRVPVAGPELFEPVHPGLARLEGPQETPGSRIHPLDATRRRLRFQFRDVAGDDGVVQQVAKGTHVRIAQKAIDERDLSQRAPDEGLSRRVVGPGRAQQRREAPERRLHVGREGPFGRLLSQETLEEPVEARAEPRQARPVDAFRHRPPTLQGEMEVQDTFLESPDLRPAEQNFHQYTETSTGSSAHPALAGSRTSSSILT